MINGFFSHSSLSEVLSAIWNFIYHSSWNFITRVSACVCTRSALARRGQDGERAEERKLTRCFYANLLFAREASRLSGSFRLPARRALALSGTTQALRQSLWSETKFMSLSKQTLGIHTMCNSLARPRMGYAPKSLLRKKYSIDINDIFPLSIRVILSSSCCLNFHSTLLYSLIFFSRWRAM